MSFELLRTIADLPDEALWCGLHCLQATEFIDETEVFPDLECAFKHTLTHEVAYGALLQDQRHGLHGRIVGAIELGRPATSNTAPYGRSSTVKVKDREVLCHHPVNEQKPDFHWTSPCVRN